MNERTKWSLYKMCLGKDYLLHDSGRASAMHTPPATQPVEQAYEVVTALQLHDWTS